MEAFWASFLIVFLAEFGDKTQFLVMAFAAKYDWRQVFAGMTLGIVVVHSVAVAAGTLIGGWIPEQIMEILVSLMFIGFGIWTLCGADEEEEEASPSRFGPLLTVALTFLAGEMGDKTQFAAMSAAVRYDSWQPVLAGAVVGMIAADSMGLLAGKFLHQRLPAGKMRYLSAGIFFLFGAAGLIRMVV